MSLNYKSARDERPNIHRVSQLPDLPEMERELKSAISDAFEFYDRNEHALEARYCIWDHQTRDGRKWGSDARAPFPWAGASDTRVRTIDMVINEKVDLMITALWKMSVQTVGTQAKEADWAGRMSALLRWYLANQMADESDSEVELLANYMLTFGSGVMGVGWLQTLAYEMKTVRLDDIRDAALQAGGPKLLLTVAEMIFDPTMHEKVIPYIQQFSNLLTKREAQKVIDDLRALAEATFPKPYIQEARPCLTALQCGQDVFFPVNTDRLQRARFVAQRELLTETELLEKVEGREGWDQDFVDEVLEHKGEMFNGNVFAYNVLERMSQIGGVWGQALNEGKDLYEVFHFYTRAQERGVPAIFKTVMHPQCADVCGSHEIHPYAHGQYPFVEFVRERTARTILASRGLPEILSTHQGEIKVQRDSRTDRASITTMPPIKVKYRPGQKQNTYGPGVEVPVIKSEDLEPMTFGAPDQTSIEVENATKRDINEYVGRSGEGVSPEAVLLGNQGLTTRWLRRWQGVGKQILQLAQQYTPPQTIGRIVGMIPKPYQITREAIAGQFDLILTFDVRFANSEFLFQMMENMNKYIFPVDTNAVVNRDVVIRYILGGIDPTLADLAVRDSEDASQQEIADEMTNFALMFSGQAPPMKMGQNYQARLNVLQQTLQSNPVLTQQVLPGRPDLQQLIEQRVKFLSQQVAQDKNKMIGRYGTTPSAGSEGGPQMGAFQPATDNQTRKNQT